LQFLLDCSNTNTGIKLLFIQFNVEINPIDLVGWLVVVCGGFVGNDKGHLGNSSSPLNLPRQFTGVGQEFDTLQIPLSLSLSSTANNSKINIF
jgi:hypothetical protein